MGPGRVRQWWVLGFLLAGLSIAGRLAVVDHPQFSPGARGNSRRDGGRPSWHCRPRPDVAP